MAKTKGKTIRDDSSSNLQSGSNRGIEKRFKKENNQHASRFNLDSLSVPAAAPTYAFVPAYWNFPAFPSAPARNATCSWAADQGENTVSMDQLSGYIFMCNGRTKADCYKYRVFGLPAGRMDVLEKIKLHMKLFLFDFDLKLLHGIYIAASCGELSIEPTAFGGKFPAQVRFEVFKDCLPLPESAFKHVIKDNYQGGHKFRQELSGKQVTNLISLFRPIAMSSPAGDEPPVFEVPHPSAAKLRFMQLPPVGAQPQSELCYPPEAHQAYRPENSAVPPQDPYRRYVSLRRDSEVYSTTNVPVRAYTTVPSQFSTPLHRHAHLASSTRTAAYWAAVASEGLKQVDEHHTKMPSGSRSLGVPVTSAWDASASEGQNQVYQTAYQSIPSGSTGMGVPLTSAWAASAYEGQNQVYHTAYQSMVTGSRGMGAPVTSAGAALAPPTVPENIDAELLQPLSTANDYKHNPAVASANATVQTHAAVYHTAYQNMPSGATLTPPTVLQNIDAELLRQLGTANDYSHNPAVASANATVQAHAAVPLQVQAPLNGPVQLPSSSVAAGCWTTVASESVPYQWQWHPSVSTGVGAENVSFSLTGAGSAPPYTSEPGSANEFASLAGTTNDYSNHNSYLSTTSNGPVQAHDQVACYTSASAYWTVHYPNQLSSGSYQVVLPHDPNQRSSGYYQALPPGSSGLAGEHLAASAAGAAATNDQCTTGRGALDGPKMLELE